MEWSRAVWRNSFFIFMKNTISILEIYLSFLINFIIRGCWITIAEEDEIILLPPDMSDEETDANEPAGILDVANTVDDESVVPVS